MAGPHTYDEMISMFVKAKLFKESFGATLLGPDLRKWPAKIVDCFALLEDEHSEMERKLLKSVGVPPSGGKK